jgi:GT2 family glycosyltransferase
MNNDVTVAPDTLARLMGVLEKRPQVGVVTPVQVYMDDPTRVFALGASVDRRTGAVSRIQADAHIDSCLDREPFYVDVAPGAAFLVRRQVLELVGFLDEAYFLYYEEADWCLRVRRAGYEIMAVPSAVIRHKVSAALGTTSPTVDYYTVRNRFRFIAQHWSGMNRVTLLLRSGLSELLAILAYTLRLKQGRRISSRNARLRALRDAALGKWGKMDKVKPIIDPE